MAMTEEDVEQRADELSAHQAYVRRNTPWPIRLFGAFVELAGKWSRGER